LAAIRRASQRARRVKPLQAVRKPAIAAAPSGALAIAATSTTAAAMRAGQPIGRPM